MTTMIVMNHDISLYQKNGRKKVPKKVKKFPKLLLTTYESCHKMAYDACRKFIEISTPIGNYRVKTQTLQEKNVNSGQ